MTDRRPTVPPDLAAALAASPQAAQAFDALSKTMAVSRLRGVAQGDRRGLVVKRHSIRRATGTPRASISLSSSYSVFGGMLIARDWLKHAYAVALRVKE